MLTPILRDNTYEGPLSWMQSIHILQMLDWTTAFCLSNYEWTRATAVRCIRHDSDQLEAIVEFLHGKNSLVEEMTENLVSPFQRTIPRKANVGLNGNTSRALIRESKRDLILSQKYDPSQIISDKELRSCTAYIAEKPCPTTTPASQGRQWISATITFK
jgi:hypothetical protein